MNKISLTSAALLVALAILSGGCASVEFLDENKTNAGFAYYPPKPYLILEKAKEGVKARVVSLPDLSREHRVKPSGGFGSLEFSFTTENGIIKSFNGKSDSKTGEIVTALTAVPGALAALRGAGADGAADEIAAADATEAKSVFLKQDLRKRLKGGSFPVAEVREALKAIDQAIKSIESHRGGEFEMILKLLKKAKKELTALRSIKYKTEKEFISEFKKLKAAVRKILRELIRIRGKIQKLENPPAAGTTGANTVSPVVQQLADEAGHHLDRAIKMLDVFTFVPTSQVMIFEIIRDGNGLRFQRVLLFSPAAK